MDFDAASDDSNIDNASASLELIIIHGSTKHAIMLLSDIPHHVFVVEDLACYVAKHFDIPVQSQKMIYKAAAKAEGTVNAKVENCTVDEDPNYKMLIKVDDAVDALEEQLKNLMIDFDGVKQGFLKQDFAKESVNKLLKKANGIIEEYMKKLELIDSFNLDGILRKRRKNIVHKIQSIIGKGDQFVEALRQYLVNSDKN